MNPPEEGTREPVQQTMNLTLVPNQMPGSGDLNRPAPDPRIPKALRDLMLANQVCEWDIQNVVELRGYFPADMNVWEYPPDFVEGVLVGAWPQVFAMIKEAKEKEAIPFN